MAPTRASSAKKTKQVTASSSPRTAALSRSASPSRTMAALTSAPTSAALDAAMRQRYRRSLSGDRHGEDSGSDAEEKGVATAVGLPSASRKAHSSSSAKNVKNDADDSKSLNYFESLLSPNPPKRRAELFFWQWHLCWLLYFAGILVLQTYETFNATSYMKVGFVVGLPPMLLPLLFPQLSGEEGIVWYKRYTTRLNLYNWIVSFIGNYWWTHYFYIVLGTSYTMPGHCLNGVPFALYLVTHSYFLLYHCAGAITIRAFWRRVNPTTVPNKALRYLLNVVVFLAMGYITAVMEVASIASFPYYTYPDAWRMWVIGSGFYGIYFLISYPLFTWLDDEEVVVWVVPNTDGANKKRSRDSDNTMLATSVPVSVAAVDRDDDGGHTLLAVATKAMAYGMVTTFMLDAWRLCFGNLNTDYSNTQHAVCVPWTEWEW